VFDIYSGICCFVDRGCSFCSAPRDFGPQIADTGRTELADGVSKMEDLLELLSVQRLSERSLTNNLNIYRSTNEGTSH
jgi:hypothetical protein